MIYLFYIFWDRRINVIFLGVRSKSTVDFFHPSRNHFESGLSSIIMFRVNDFAGCLRTKRNLSNFAKLSSVVESLIVDFLRCDDRSAFGSRQKAGSRLPFAARAGLPPCRMAIASRAAALQARQLGKSWAASSAVQWTVRIK